jgi:hypothetical protein
MECRAGNGRTPKSIAADRWGEKLIPYVDAHGAAAGLAPVLLSFSDVGSEARSTSLHLSIIRILPGLDCGLKSDSQLRI